MRHPLLAVSLSAAFLACSPSRLATPIPLASPAGPGAMAPDLVSTDAGVWMSWLEPEVADSRSAWSLRAARLVGEAWEPTRTVAQGTAFFVNWADFPSLAARDGELLVHRLEKLGASTYAYGVFLSRSTDGGASWEERGLLHDDSSPAEHGFVSWASADAASADGGTVGVWLDGRATPDGGAMQLRAARVEDGVAAPSIVLDDAVCDCCQTAAAWTARGLAVAYRDRSSDEVRDIYLVRGEGATWTAPRAVHDDGWKIFGCPVNGPAIAADGERLAVAWFTAAGDLPRVLLAFSDDAGDSFGPPVEIDAVEPLGRVDLALDAAGDALVSWLAQAENQRGETAGAEVRLQRIARDGRRGPALTVATTSGERSAGFPRLARDGERLLLAWVETATPSAIRVAAIPLAE